MKSALRTRILALAALLALCALLLPMLAVARYDAPQLDDFLYGKDTETAWAATQSLPAAFTAGAGTAARLYREWQGTYTATFLMAMHPGVWGLSYYAATPYILIGALLIGLFAFMWSAGRHLLGCPPAERLILFALSAILCTQLLPSPVQAFYWFNGAIFYTFYFALMLLFFALLIGFYHRTPGQKRNILYYILLPLLAAFLAGGNYSTALQMTMLLAAAVLWQFTGKRSRNLLPPLTLALFLALFALSLTAPGNSLHQTQPGGLATAFVAGVKACAKALRSWVRWTTLPVLIGAAACVPVAWRFAARTDFRFRFPPLVMAGSFLLLAAGFMPTLYTQDYSGSDRLLDIQFYTHVLLLLINVFYCTGWLRRRLPDIALPRAACLVSAVLALAILAGSYDAFTSFEAAKSLFSGEAAGYKAEFDARTEILENPAIRDAVLPPLTNMPKLLCITDYGEDPQTEINLVVGGTYYEKDSLRIDTTP